MPLPYLGLLHTLIICLTTLSLFSQRGFKAYKQNIPGTEVSFKMIPIKAGTFNMGSTYSDVNSNEDERPIHHVELDPFWMADHETTWNLYQLFVDRTIDSLNRKGVKNPSITIEVDGVSGASIPYIDMSLGMGTDGYPVINVSQHAASTFCEWLSAMTGHYYRLPTEAEWEYACRAGSEEDYHFGRDESLDDYAWYNTNSGETYHPIKTKKANRWKLYDMNGNVAEWTLDQYIETGYEQHESHNPYNEPTKKFPRVVRGGSWMDKASALRCSSRLPSSRDWNRRDPQYPQSKWWRTDAPFLGFRVVRPYFVPSPTNQKKYWIHKN